jgi:hypothetical protein
MPVFESGIWDTVTISEEDAKRLVGGMLYLHETKKAPSYFGGIVTGYRRGVRGEDKARKEGWIFTVVSTLEGKKKEWSEKGRRDINAFYSGIIEE